MPTLDYLTGFNHRVTTLGTAAQNLGAGATIAIDTSTVRRSGGTSLKLNANSTSQTYQTYLLSSASAVLTVVYYINYSSFGSISAGFQFLAWTSVNQTNRGVGITCNNIGSLRWAYETNGFNGQTNSIGSAAGVTLSLNTWYRIEARIDVSSNPWLLDWQIATGDGPAAAQTQTTAANAATTWDTFMIGDPTANSEPHIFDLTDLAWSLQSGDYPIGPVSVYGYSPRFVGTHNLDASTSTFFFRDTAAPPGGSTDALTTSETSSQQVLDDLPFDTGTDAIKVTMGGTPVTNTPSVRSVGTWSFTPNNVSTPATLTPGAPAGKAVGDLLLLICESRSIVGTVATPAGWSAVTNSPVRSGTASGGTIYLFTRIADGTGSDTPSPVWSGLGSTGTTGDSCGAGIMAIQNAQAVLDATLVSQDLSAQGATSTITGVTTVTDKSIVVNVAVKQNEASGQTATVTNYTEQSDNSTTSGTGHIVETSSLVKTPLGASGSGTITWSATTSARVLIASIALKATTSLSQPTNTWYAEYGFVVPEVAIPSAVRAIVAQELDTAVASTWAAKLFDSVQGTNTEDVSNGSISTTTKTFVGKTFPGLPSPPPIDQTDATSWNFGQNQITGTTSAGNPKMGAQTFTGVSGTLIYVTISLAKLGSPTDNLQLDLCSGAPTGTTEPSVIVTSTTTLPASSLPTSAPADFTFVFPQTAISSGSTYSLVLRRTGTADIVNSALVAMSASDSAYAGGHGWTLDVSTGWATWTDWRFQIGILDATPWTLAALQGIRLRFGYTAAASGHPRLAAAMLEAAFPAPVAEATPLVEAHKTVPFYPRPSRPS